MPEPAPGATASPRAVALPDARRPRLVPSADATPDEQEHAALLRAQRIGRTGWWEYDYVTDRVTTSDALRELTGLDSGALSGESLAAVHVEDRPGVEAALRRFLDTGAPLDLRFRCARPGETDPAWFTARGEAERDRSGALLRATCVVSDISGLVRAEEELRAALDHAATHDELTGLPNRRYVQERLEKLLAERGPGAAAVLIVDIDGFKRVNDAHGHAVGDTVLVVIANRIVQATRGRDIVARLGGDEFAVLVWFDDAASAAELADAVASRIERSLADPIKARGRECSVTASIGISLVEQDAAADDALAGADAALYAVKRHGANGHAIFDSELADRTKRDEAIERSLRRALREDLVEVHYQPIVAPGNGFVHAVEALVRIRDDDGALLDAGAVIAVAERVGLVSELDDRVLRQACDHVAAWRSQPLYGELRLSINRSAQDILRPGFYDRIAQALDSTALPATALTLEITETVLLDAAEPAMADIRRLYARGVRLAIDDFGTGYASLSQLTKLPISTIKIDRSFTSNMLHDRTCRALVRATVGIASDLRFDCVVEGVETEEHLAALPRYDRLLIQGYLYGRPRPAQDGLGVTVAHW
jgi:diguanylate cyclase (GGDEF)-like protein